MMLAYGTQKTIDFDADCLSVFPFLDTNFISKLRTKLPTYLAKCADTSKVFSALMWKINPHGDSI